MKTSCISHPPKTPLVIIREEYLAICDGDHCEAAVLNQFEYWTNVKLGYREQAETEGKIARAGGAEIPSSDLWIYKTQAELHEELMGLFGIRAIGTALQSLVDRGFLERRNNPKYAWDRTYQYRLQTTKVQDAILQKCKFEKAKAQSQKQQESDIESTENEAALPEITTEITSEKTIEKETLDFPENPQPTASSPFQQGDDYLGVSAKCAKAQAEAGNSATPPSAGGSFALGDRLITVACARLGRSEPQGDKRKSARAFFEKALKAEGLLQGDVIMLERAVKDWLDPEGEYAFFLSQYALSPKHGLALRHFGIVLSKATSPAAATSTRRARDVEAMEASLAALEERQAARSPSVEGDWAWEAAKRELALQMAKSTFGLWVRDTVGLGREDGVYTVAVPDALAKDWLTDRLKTTAERTLVGILGEAVEVRFEEVES